jgi:chaperonin GroES
VLVSRAVSPTPVEPLGDRIIVKRLAVESRPSGIVLPESMMREQSDRGEVLAVGPGRQTDSGETLPVEGVEVGDVVVFGPYAGSLIVVDDEDYLLLRVGDVLGKLTAVA